MERSHANDTSNTGTNTIENRHIMTNKRIKYCNYFIENQSFELRQILLHFGLTKILKTDYEAENYSPSHRYMDYEAENIIMQLKTENNNTKKTNNV
jgi:hypothetical protein